MTNQAKYTLLICINKGYGEMSFFVTTLAILHLLRRDADFSIFSKVNIHTEEDAYHKCIYEFLQNERGNVSTTRSRNYHC